MLMFPGPLHDDLCLQGAAINIQPKVFIILVHTDDRHI